MKLTRFRNDGLPWIEALGVATGLTLGFAVAFVLLGPATASIPVMLRTVAIVLSMIVVGQRVGAKEFDRVFAMAAALAVLVIGATVLVY